LSLPFVDDSEEAQKFGTLYFERLVGKTADVQAEAWLDMMGLNPDTVLGISGALYDSAVNADMVIDSLSISADMVVSIKGEQFGHSLSIFDDLSPSALSIAEDDSTGTWTPIIGGSDGTDSQGNYLNILTKHLRIVSGGTIKVGVRPSTDGGLSIDETHIAGYSAVGTKTLELTYSGIDEGDAYFGDYDSGNAGVKYDHSEAILNVRGSISIQNPADVRTDINVADGADVTANNPQSAAWLTDGGALATLSSIDLSYVTDAGALAGVDSDALVYFSTTAPSNPSANPLWTDTSSVPYQLNRWTGTAWEVISTLNTGALADLDTIDTSYLTDAGALATLDSIDTSYVTDAGDLATVDADALVYFSSTAPTTPANHPLWGDTSSAPYKLKRWSGTAWEVIATLNTGALADLDVVDFSSLADDGGTLEISNSVLRVLGADGIQLEPGADLFVNSEAGNSGSIYFLTAAGEYVEFAANYSDGILFISPKTYDTSGLWVGYSDAGTTDKRFRRIVTSSHSLDMFVANRSGSSGWIRLSNYHKQAYPNVDLSTELWINRDDVYIQDWSSPAGGGGFLRVANTIYPYNGIAFGGPGNDVLDDYEEGVYTVTCTPSTSGSVTLLSTRDVLQYQKIGNWCHVQGSVEVASVSSPVGLLEFSLPFTIASGTEIEDRASGSIIIDGVDMDAGCLWMSVYVANYFTNVFRLVEIRDNVGKKYYGSSATLKAGDILTFGFTYKTA
jgi:hypothetical protein